MVRHVFCLNRRYAYFCMPAVWLASIVFLVTGPAPVLSCVCGPCFVRVIVKIDPKAPLEKLLPKPPTVPESVLPWLIKDLAEVPEIHFQKPLPQSKKIIFEKDEFKILVGKEEERIPDDIQEREKIILRIIQQIASINHLNEKGGDHFLKLLIKQRPDLAGLPFVMGDACRLPKEPSRQFSIEVESVRNAMATSRPEFWKHYRPQADKSETERKNPIRPRIAALMQMLATESPSVRKGLVQYLKDFPGTEATVALARLAVFSFEEEVRTEALEALKNRPEKQESAEILLSGLRYPWPSVSANAARAIAKLERKDLVPALIGFLDERDPRAPARREIAGRKAIVVRELVRINHHHNCLLCHAPGNTGDIVFDNGIAKEVVTAPVPIPDQELPSSSQGYGLGLPDMLVRADVTYLRQDFSLLQRVKNAKPWPDLQRYDFLVRTREITSREADAYRVWREKQGPDYRAPQHQAALQALQTITVLK